MSAARVTTSGQLLHVAAEIECAPLSQHFADVLYRIRPDDQPKWLKTTASSRPCDECAWLQHETGGTYGLRKAPRHRRCFIGGPTLLLCALHAEAWRERDTADLTSAQRNHIPPIA